VSGFFSYIGRGRKCPRFLKTNNNMSKERNNCYQCPHRRKVTGSAHSACNIGMMPIKFVNKETGEKMIKLDPIGVQMGWCYWPFNFDPTWVECYLPIEKTENNG